MNQNLESALQRFKFFRGLSLDLLTSLSEAELQFTPGEGQGPLWKQFRHLGRVHENYADALWSGTLKFDPKLGTFGASTTAPELKKYLEAVDQKMRATLTTLGPGKKIRWGKLNLPVSAHVHNMTDHEVLHQGQWVIYMNGLKKPFPKSWSVWGL